MAEFVTIARPYAQAVYRLAKETGSQTAWLERLQRLAAIAQDKEMSKVIGNPKFSARQVADLLISLTGESTNRELSSFIELLAENERLDVMAQILEIFEEIKGEDEGIRDALITSAYPLDDTQLKSLIGQLEKHFGGKLRPTVEVAEALIGGIKVTVGDQVLDISVRGKLEAMATALKN